jgi:hypothetical protein
MELKAQIKNGRLIIESDNEEGSIKLDRWINENKRYFNKMLDIDIFAY